MSDSDKTLKLLIELGVIGEDKAAEVKKLLKETKTEAADMTQSMPDNLAAWEKYKTSMRGAAESAESLGHHTREMRELMAGAGPVAQELGHLLHFAFDPALLAGVLGAGGLELYFHHLEKIAERQREIIQGLSEWGNWLKEIVKAGGNMYEDAQRVARATAEAKAQQESLGQTLKEFEERSKIFNEQSMHALEERIDLRKSESDIMAGQVGMLEAMHRLTADQGEQAKLELAHHEKVQEILDKRVKAQKEYNSAKSDYDEELKMVGGPAAFSPEAIGAAQGNADATAARRNQAEEIIKSVDTQIAGLKQHIAEENERIKRDPLNWNQDSTANIEFRQQLADAESRKKAAEGSLKVLDEEAARAAVALKDVTGLKDKFEGLANSLTMLHAKVTEAAADQPKEIGAENQRYAIEAVTKMLQGGATPESIVRGGIGAMGTLNQIQQQTGFTPAEYQQRGSPQQQQYVQHLQQQVQALAMLEDAAGNSGQQVIAAINRVMHATNGVTSVQQMTTVWLQRVQSKLAVMQEQINSLTANHR
jgi:hypothetical protein